MIITTTHHIQDRKIIAYKGIVTGEAILGTNIFKDFMAGIRDIVGGRSGAYEKSLREAREIAFSDIERAAIALGANAVIGVDIDYENISAGGNSSLLMVSVTGTAIQLD